MPRETEMPRTQREGPLRTGGGPPTMKMDRSHSLPPPPQMGNGGHPPAHLPSSSLFDQEEWLRLKWSLPPPRAPSLSALTTMAQRLEKEINALMEGGHDVASRLHGGPGPPVIVDMTDKQDAAHHDGLRTEDALGPTVHSLSALKTLAQREEKAINALLEVRAHSERAYTASWGGMDDIWGDARRKDERCRRRIVDELNVQARLEDALGPTVCSLSALKILAQREEKATNALLDEALASRVAYDKALASRAILPNVCRPHTMAAQASSATLADARHEVTTNSAASADPARPRSPLKAGNVLVDTSDEHDAARHDGLQLLLDEHAASTTAPS